MLKSIHCFRVISLLAIAILFFACGDTNVPAISELRLASREATTATITLRVSERAVLLWVLYTDDAPAPKDVVELIFHTREGIGGRIVASSGRAGQVVPAGMATITIRGLANNANYDFYIVARDAAANTSAVSPKLDVDVAMTGTTEDTTAPMVTSPQVSPTSSGATVMVTIDEAATLFWALYTDGATAPADSAALIAAASQAPSGDVVRTSGMDGQSASAGTATTIMLSELTANTMYDFYLVARDAAGNASAPSKLDVDTTAPDTTAPMVTNLQVSSASATGATIEVTINENATLFWALYNNGVAPSGTDGTAFITNVASQAASGDIVQTSMGTNQSATANTATTITLSNLAVGTNYDFYLVAQDAAGNASAPSKLDVDDGTPPTITAPQVSTVSATEATVTVTINEAATLFWVLYTDGAPRPTDSNALINAAGGAIGGNIVKVSGSGVFATANTAKTITLIELTDGTNYDFYLVARDTAGNASAPSKLDVATSVAQIVLTSSQMDGGFNNGGTIPNEFTNWLPRGTSHTRQCDGNNNFPKLTWSNIPSNTQALVLIVEDIDSRPDIWVHLNAWYNKDGNTALPTELGRLLSGHPMNSLTATSNLPTFPVGWATGDNSWDGSRVHPNEGWGGPCPPSGTHRYYFKLYALSAAVSNSTGIDEMTRSAFENANTSNILSSSEIFGRASR